MPCAVPCPTAGLLPSQKAIPMTLMTGSGARVATPAIPRPRLLSRLLSAWDRGGASLTAPAGYGKTTVVRQFLATDGRPWAWVRLGDVAGHPAQFVQALAEAVAALTGPLPQEWTALAAAQWPVALDLVIGALAEAPPMWLVLDDLHAADGMPVSAAVAALVEALPETVRLLVLGRWLPAACGLRVDGSEAMLEVGLDSLRLDAYELAAVVFRMADWRLDDVAAGGLVRAGDGWIAGLIMALHGMVAAGEYTVPLLRSRLQQVRDDFPGVAAAVIQALPETLLHPMLQLAVLGLWQPAFETRLTPAPDFAAVVATCEARGLFWQRHTDQSAAFHPLMQAALLAEVHRLLALSDRASPGDFVLAPSLGAFWALTEPVPPIVQLQMAVGHGSGIGEVLRTVVLDGLRLADISGLRTLRDLLPPACRLEPWGRFLVAECFRFVGAFADAREALAEVSVGGDPELAGLVLASESGMDCQTGDPAGLARAERALAVLPETAAWARAQVLTVLGSYRSNGSEYELALTDYRQALSAYEAVGDSVGSSRALANIGMVLGNQGRYGEAITVFLQAIEVAKRGQRLPNPLIYVGLGEAARYLGRLRQGLAWVDEGLALACSLDIRSSAARLRRQRAVLLARLGDLDQAERDAAEALTWGQESGDPTITARALAMLIEVACRRGQPDTALVQAGLLQRTLGDSLMDAAYTFAPMVLIRLALDRHDWSGAAVLVDQLIEALRDDDSPWHLAKAYHYLSCVRQGEGDGPGAMAALAQYQAFDGIEGYATVVVDDGMAADWVPPKAIVCRCVGRLRLLPSADGEPITIPGQKLYQLLALLLIAPQGITRETIAERLYAAGKGTKSAILMLVNRLRHALAAIAPPWDPMGAILFQEGRYLLNPALRMDCDLRHFNDAWEDAERASSDAERADAYQRMVERVSGPLLDGAGDAAWLQEPRVEAQGRWQVAVNWLNDRGLKPVVAGKALRGRG